MLAVAQRERENGGRAGCVVLRSRKENSGSPTLEGKEAAGGDASCPSGERSEDSGGCVRFFPGASLGGRRSECRKRRERLHLVLITRNKTDELHAVLAVEEFCYGEAGVRLMASQSMYQLA